MSNQYEIHTSRHTIHTVGFSRPVRLFRYGEHTGSMHTLTVGVVHHPGGQVDPYVECNGRIINGPPSRSANFVVLNKMYPDNEDRDDIIHHIKMTVSTREFKAIEAHLLSELTDPS